MVILSMRDMQKFLDLDQSDLSENETAPKSLLDRVRRLFK